MVGGKVELRPPFGQSTTAHRRMAERMVENHEGTGRLDLDIAASRDGEYPAPLRLPTNP
jgi:hypothetical protein